MKFSNFFNLFMGSALSLFFTSCGPSYKSNIADYLSTGVEETRCDTSTQYTNGITINGIAQFEKRSLEVVTENYTIPASGSLPSTTGTKLKGMALSDPLPSPLPIKFAEVSIYNSSNQRIQCGVTNASGNILAVDGVSSLKIPNVSGQYKLRLVSRSFHDYGGTNNTIYISIKKDIYKNDLHALTANFSLPTSNSTITLSLLAHARETDSEGIEGGAFNILNSLQTGFDYIKNNTPNITSCLSSKLDVFWKPGFNPMQYQSPEADPQTLSNTSFYKSDTKQLFISGGQLGDMSLSNTDHFDDFVIIHESGHFIEDHCGQWTSPGGNHALVSRIDPRLAWSEGWANYFAANVIHDRINDLDPTISGKLSVLTENLPTNYGWTYLFNSYGFSDSVQQIGNGDGFTIDFKRSGSDPGTYQIGPYLNKEFDKVTPSAYPGEGHTREGAVSRGLFKLTNICGAFCATTPVSFQNIWQSFDRITGTATTNIPFQASDRVLEKIKTVNGGSWTTDQKTTLESEALHLVSDGAFGASPLLWPGYGNKLITGSSCNLKIQPRSDSSLNNTSSDQRYSNHFYTIDLNSLAGLNQISVTFTKNSGSNIDHDLILFKPGYFFNDDYTCGSLTNTGSCVFTANRNSWNEDIFVMNRAPASSSAISGTNTKTIYLNGIDNSQMYLLDLRAFTAGISMGNTTDYSYVINSNLGVLCPQ